MVSETQNQYEKLKEDSHAINNGVAADDRYEDDVSKYNSECEENKKIPKEQLSGNETPISKHAMITGNPPLPINNDSGIELDFDVITREIKNQVDIFVSEKLSSFGMKSNKEMRTNIDNKRKVNIIIHGLDEKSDGDEVSIKKIFDLMGMEIDPSMTHRLGAKKENRARPVKIVMKSESHKASFMSKLWMLKHGINQKIRVTDDYTWEEREEIRRWIKMANERNEKDNEGRTKNYKWKVRGTPKTGMRIVQIRM